MGNLFIPHIVNGRKGRVLNCKPLLPFYHGAIDQCLILLMLSEINLNDKALRVCETFIIGKLDINNKVICFHDKKKKEKVS